MLDLSKAAWVVLNSEGLPTKPFTLASKFLEIVDLEVTPARKISDAKKQKPGTISEPKFWLIINCSSSAMA